MNGYQAMSSRIKIVKQVLIDGFSKAETWNPREINEFCATSSVMQQIVVWNIAGIIEIYQPQDDTGHIDRTI